MSSVQFLREFISERLTAAAEEIFTEFERTIVQYEEELERQRRLLEISWKPTTNVHREELPQDFLSKEEDVPVDQQEPEPPQIKEEHKKLWIIQEEEQLVVKPTYEESDHSDSEPNGDWVLSDSFPVTERDDEEGSRRESGAAERKSKKRQNQNRSHTVLRLGPVKCDVCGKAFRYHSNMKVHYRVHTGEKPFSCKVCEKAFSHKVNLFVHMRTHTGEKPFLCKICGKGFSHGSSLKKHVGSHR